MLLISCSTIGRWSACVVMWGLGASIVTGCVAQQADVVRIKRELDAKISQLDKSKTSLQQAVNDANIALEKANGLIAQQRAEIKGLLHARAEVMDQMATLKETDLSHVRGAIEKNQHQVNELHEKISHYDAEMNTIQVRFQQSEPLLHQIRDRLAAEEQLLMEQGGKLGEFRTSLVDYQQVLASLRQQMAQQDQRLSELQKHVERVGHQHEVKEQQTQANFEEIRRSIQSVVGTLEKVTTTFGGRLDEHEQKLSRVADPSSGSISRRAPIVGTHPSSARPANPDSLMPMRAASSQAENDLSRESIEKKNQSEGAGANAAYASSSYATRPVQAVGGRSATASLTGVEERESPAKYDKALTLLRQGEFHRAAREFAAFLREEPHSAFAANAQYWLGECFYGQRHFQEAIDEFERVFAFYPASNKVPASLLKIAYSHLELQQLPMARSVFQQLVRTHPQSPEARKAYGRLREVNALLETPS